MENTDELYVFLKVHGEINGEEELCEYLNMLYEGNFKTLDQIFDRFEDFKKILFRMSTEAQAKINNALQKHKQEKLAGNADKDKMTSLQQLQGPPDLITPQTRPFQPEILNKNRQVEEEKKEPLISEEFQNQTKGQPTEHLKFMNELRTKNPLPHSFMTYLKTQFSNIKLADSEQVLALEEKRKSENERYKSISLMYLFSQPLVETISKNNKVIHEIFPMTVKPLDNYGEYRKLTGHLEKTRQHLSIKSQYAIKEAFRDEVVTKCKVIHISCHGQDQDSGTYLEFEMQELVGKLQRLAKNIINKDQFKDKNNDIRLIVLSACQSQKIGQLLQEKYKKTAIIAVAEDWNIKFSAARKFTKELYTYLYITAGFDIGTPLEAFKYAIKRMTQSNHMPHLQEKIADDAQNIKFINETAEYAKKPVFSSSEVGRLYNFNPRENPALGEEFFSKPDPTKKKRFQAFERLTDVHYIFMQQLQNSLKNLTDEDDKKLIQQSIKSNTMKLYKMLWYLSDRIGQNSLDPRYQNLIPFINETFPVKEELSSLSLGDLDELQPYDQQNTILQISKGNRLRNSLSSNYVIQYCLDRKVLSKAFYVDARKGQLRAIDYDNGQDIIKSQKEMPFIKFLESVDSIMYRNMTHVQNETKNQLIAALVIDHVDETEQSDIQQVILSIQDIVQQFNQRSKSILRVILIHQKEASFQIEDQNFSYLPNNDPYNRSEVRYQADSDTWDDDEPQNEDLADRDPGQEETKAFDGIGKSKQDGIEAPRKYLGQIEYMNLNQAITVLQESQTANTLIQAYRDQHPFDPFHKYKDLSEQDKKKELEQLNLFRKNVNFMDGVYSGQFSKNPLLPHGYGIFIQNQSGTIYEGERINGLRSGYGRLIQDNGLIYEGQWSENWPHGEGCVRYPSKLEDSKCDLFCGTFNKSSRENWGTLLEQQNKKLYHSIWTNDCLGERSFVKYPDGKVKLEYLFNGNSDFVQKSAGFVSFYVIPGFQNMAFSVIKKGQKVNPQMIGLFNPSIRLQEIEVKSQDLLESAQDNNLCLAAPLEGECFLLFHRCTIKQLVFESDYMINEEHKEFCSSIATLDMRFSPISKKGYILGPSDPIDLYSSEARLIMERFRFSIINPRQDQLVKLEALLINLIGGSLQSVVDTVNQTENMDEADSVITNNQIDAPVNSSLIQSNSNNIFDGAGIQNYDQQQIMQVTAPLSTITDEPSIKFLIIDQLRGLKNSHGTLYLGVRPGKRIVTENIVRDLKQYFVIKKPKNLNITDIERLEREYQIIQATGEHINLIRMEEYHTENNIVYLALDFAIAKSLYHYLTQWEQVEGAVNLIVRNNERWTRYLFRQFIAGLQKIHQANIAHLNIKINNSPVLSDAS